jgi:hypothetical protein
MTPSFQHLLQSSPLGHRFQQCLRGLLQLRQWKLGVTVNNFFIGQIPQIFLLTLVHTYIHIISKVQ